MNATSSTRRHPFTGCASSRSLLAAEEIANNTDLLTEILVCLPVTSLIQFKSVSKHWLSLISDSRFAIKHTARNPRPSPSALFFCRNSWVAEPLCVSLQGHRNPPTAAFLDGALGAVKYFPTIIHSSHGLQLWQYRYGISPDDCKNNCYLVCNPTTRSYKLLPSRPLAYGSRGFLAFDPSKSPHHKVVFMDPYPSVQIDIYFSESSSWRQFHPPYRMNFIYEVLCGSVIHWISERDVIVGFDIDSEKMLELPDPPAMDRTRLFGECGGRLTLLESNTAVAFRILEMDKDRWRWIVKFQVNLGPLLSVFPELESTINNYWILCVVEGENEKDFGLVLLIQGKVVYYNLKSGTWNVLHDGPFSDISPYNNFPFVASLAPL